MKLKMENKELYLLTFIVSLFFGIICFAIYTDYKKDLECYKHNPNNGQVCKG